MQAGSPPKVLCDSCALDWKLWLLIQLEFPQCVVSVKVIITSSPPSPKWLREMQKPEESMKPTYWLLVMLSFRIYFMLLKIYLAETVFDAGYLGLIFVDKKSIHLNKLLSITGFPVLCIVH